MSLRFCFVFLFISTIPVLLSALHLLVTVKDIENNTFNTTINGYISRFYFPFDGKVVKQLFIRDQTIGNLGSSSVSSLSELRVLSFWGCKIDSISPGAFGFLPYVWSIQLSYGNIKEIPRNVFNKHVAFNIVYVLPSLQLLRLDNNEIDTIEDEAFANLFLLKTIHVNSNKLEYWNREWFTNSTALEIMNFQTNRIRTIQRRAFANLPKLKQIFFDFNEISVIHPDAFLGITNLDYLGLRYNRLTEIKGDIFPNYLKIRSFLIDANYLNFLPDGVLQKMSVKDITMDNNPWKCACLDRIQFWLYRTNGSNRAADGCTGPNIPVCAIPTSYSRACLEFVDPGLTERYIKSLKDINPPLPKFCARID